MASSSAPTGPRAWTMHECPHIPRPELDLANPCAECQKVVVVALPDLLEALREEAGIRRKGYRGWVWQRAMRLAAGFIEFSLYGKEPDRE